LEKPKLKKLKKPSIKAEKDQVLINELILLTKPLLWGIITRVTKQINKTKGLLTSLSNGFKKWTAKPPQNSQI
jgi:hypothetical protein